EAVDELGPERVLSVTLDCGHLRAGELEEIKRHATAAGLTLKVVDKSAEFLEKIGMIVDSEGTRDVFQKIYERVAIEEATAFGGKEPAVVLQGTLLPDVIESGGTGGAVIKRHHNYGLNLGNLTEVKPLSHLYKDDVRKLAREQGLPESVFNREPFPGPGGFLRILVPITAESLAVWRASDSTVRGLVRNHEISPKIAQLVTAIIARAPGVKGDIDVNGYIIAVRPVATTRYMTAKGLHLPVELEDEIIERVTKHPLVTHCVFDYTPKPPATIEFK
ncbi:MAG: GMP synthase (glutamine-hydrolyzing), partial [bacterium]|nr:GMP synthase (glutamine-hydrolyzing) [bacterium]